jgi:hypothetical protein
MVLINSISFAKLKSTVSRFIRPPIRRHLVVLFVCVLLSVWGVRGVWHDAQSSIPTTRSGSATVPLFNVWTILWNSGAAEDGFAGYWDAPIFSPMSGTFALSEPQPLTVVLTPLRWFGASPGLMYNLWLVSSLTLNGYLAWRVLSAIGCRLIPACAGAAGMVLHPMVHDQLDVLQLVSLWPSLWVILALIDMRRLALADGASARQWGFASIQLALAGFCTAATCLHHCLFLLIVLCASGWLLLVRRSFGRWFVAMSVAFVLACMLVLPWLLPMRAILKANQFSREETLVAQLSAVMPDLINVSKGNLFPALSRHDQRPWYMSPGNLRTLLATLCLPMMIWLQRRGSPISSMTVSLMAVSFLIAFVVVSGALSLGTNLDVGGMKLWTRMSQLVPGLAQIRSAFRFGYFYQMGILLLASLTLNAFQSLLSTAGWRRFLCRALVCACAMVVAAEVLPSPLRRVAVPTEDEQTPWINTVKSARKGTGGVLMVPFAPGSNVEDFELTTRWMISFVATDLRLVNGYSGFFPRLHYDWQKFLASKPTPWQLAERMRANDVEFVVIMDDEFQKLMDEPVVVGLMFDEIKTEETRSIRVYRLR